MDVAVPAQQVSVSTLVPHVEGDLIAPLKEGRRLAALIPDERFVQ